jgi:DNA-binding transcriptional regulator YiaG
MSPKRKPNALYQWNHASVQGLRKHLGSTQGELAEELGVRQQTVSEWENGVYQPTGASVKLLTIVAERAGFQYEVGGSASEVSAPKEPDDASS